MKILTIPVLSDNYQYLLVGESEIAAVDPAESDVVLVKLREIGLPLSAILVTHEDSDHVAGVPALARETKAQVIGPRHPAGSRVAAAGCLWEIIPTPGHCREHVAFYSKETATLFSGDCLFGAGCGRLREPPERMFESLQTLARLPLETRVYFGHEYTRDNLRFALTVEPENVAMRDRLEQLKEPTTPSVLSLELATNPFLRARTVAEFAERRRRKDVFD